MDGSITFDTDVTVSIVRPDLIKISDPFRVLHIRTANKRSVNFFQKVEVHLCLGRLEFYQKVLVSDAVDEAVLDAGILTLQMIVVDFKNNVLRIGYKDVMLYTENI